MRFAKYFDKDLYSKFHRKFEGIAMIDIDSVEVCPSCYEPLAMLETCYDKGQKYKATTLVYTLAKRLNIPSFLVFYKDIGQGSLAFRIKRLWLSNPQYELMNEEEWVAVLYHLQAEHKKVCKHNV